MKIYDLASLQNARLDNLEATLNPKTGIRLTSPQDLKFGKTKKMLKLRNYVEINSSRDLRL